MISQGLTVALKSKAGNVLAGRGARTRVMALVGATRLGQADVEARKLGALARMPDGPDIVSDLSLCLTPVPIWRRIATETNFASAALPIYTVQAASNGAIADGSLVERALQQMEGGVAMLTIHPTPSPELLEAAQARIVPATSRGGGMVVRDLQAAPGKPNVYLRILDELAAHARKHEVVLSLGASFRSANIFDAMDDVQAQEIEEQVRIGQILSTAGVQVVIEGPGHARPAAIRQFAMRLADCPFPVMPLGPMPTDASVGVDHVAAAIGAVVLGLQGKADILAAVTREEHTGGVPRLESIIEAVTAARVAAHVIDIDLLSDDGADRAVVEARAMYETCIAGAKTGGCSRCGRFCPLVTTSSKARSPG